MQDKTIGTWHTMHHRATVPPPSPQKTKDLYKLQDSSTCKTTANICKFSRRDVNIQLCMLVILCVFVPWLMKRTLTACNVYNQDSVCWVCMTLVVYLHCHGSAWLSLQCNVHTRMMHALHLLQGLIKSLWINQTVGEWGKLGQGRTGTLLVICFLHSDTWTQYPAVLGFLLYLCN